MGKAILNIGHGGIKYDTGACGNGFVEHEWNKDFVNNYVVPECKKLGVEHQVVYQEYYSTLSRKINMLAKKGDVTLSFHLNAAGEMANGVEMLYWNKSEKSKKLAESMQRANLEVTGLRDRKILPRDYADRGATLLRKTVNPCVIIESGFITSKNDMETLEKNKSELAKSYVLAIKDYLENKTQF